jgi:hypothetical protein
MYAVCVSDALVAEIKRIVKESEILKCVKRECNDSTRARADNVNREDDTKWPQKNKDGRQELEIRLGSEHISFEVRKRRILNRDDTYAHRLPKSARYKMCKTPPIQRVFASSTTLSRI